MEVEWTLGVLCVVSAAFRLLLICWARIQDYALDVAFTDVDYRVFTEAGRAVWEGRSPYEVPTFRYSPLLAFLAVPNLDLPDAGKALFNAADLLASVLIHRMVRRSGASESEALMSASLWLFSPFTAVISSRGSAEGIVALTVLGSLYLLVTGRWALAALVHGGLAIPLKIYPVIYAPSVFLFLLPATSSLALTRPVESLGALLSNWRGWAYGLLCAGSAAAVTGLSYAAYGQPFLDQAVLYHVGRVDVRHNFSPYFYLLYLAESSEAAWTKHLGLIAFVPQASVILVSAFRFGRRDLGFAWLVSTFAFVSFNKVVTSQYFSWYLCLVPVCWAGLSRCLTGRQALGLLLPWLAAQGVWLGLAYLLEFHGSQVFLPLGLASLGFLLVNGWALAALLHLRSQSLMPSSQRKTKSS